METWNYFSAVVLVLACLVGTLLWLKSRGILTSTALPARLQGGKDRELKVIDKVVVSAHHTLVLVEVKDTRLLVCLSPTGAQTTVLKGEA